MRRDAKDFTIAGKSFNTLWHGCVDQEEVTPNSFKYGNAKIFHQPHPAARLSNQKKEEGWFAMKRYLEKYENV